MKIILLDLTETDYNNYDTDTLYVDTVYALGDSYGWVTRRQDTIRNIDVPFDFRGRKYRRFEVDLSAVNSSLGTGYWGIGDDFLGQGTTGNYKDFKSFGNDGYDTNNIKWIDMGGPDMYYYRGYNDNNVYLGTIGDNTIGSYFINNTVGDTFYYNTVGSFFRNNTVGYEFRNNKVDSFASNKVGDSFVSNTIGNFLSNSVGDGFRNNIVCDSFGGCTVGNNFRLNQITTSISSVNFTSATHVYGNYTCNIFQRSNNTSRLSYIDGSDVIQYTAVNA
jgi:hypothetical protein